MTHTESRLTSFHEFEGQINSKLWTCLEYYLIENMQTQTLNLHSESESENWYWYCVHWQCLVWLWLCISKYNWNESLIKNPIIMANSSRQCNMYMLQSLPWNFHWYIKSLVNLLALKKGTSTPYTLPIRNTYQYFLSCYSKTCTHSTVLNWMVF